MRIHRIAVFFCTFLVELNLTMAADQFPTLKRLASEAYWKYNDRMPTPSQINGDVQMLLITYAPLYESAIGDIVHNSKFLNDGTRTRECEKFIAEKIVRGSDVSILMTGFKNGILYNPRQMMSTNFAEIKKRRVKNYVERANISPNELAIDIECNPAEERLFACSQTWGIVGCEIFAILVGYGFVRLWDYFHE